MTAINWIYEPRRQQVMLLTLTDELAAWSDATFGTPSERGPVPPLHHLAKEVQEAIASPADVIEYADCLLLVLDAARRAGFDTAALLTAAHDKLAICKERRYTVRDEHGVIEHERETCVNCGASLTDEDISALGNALCAGCDLFDTLDAQEVAQDHCYAIVAEDDGPLDLEDQFDALLEGALP